MQTDDTQPDEELIPNDCNDDPNEYDRLRLRVLFPNCWNGVNPGDTNWATQMRYSWQKNDGDPQGGSDPEAECPTNYDDHLLSQLRLGVQWDVEGYDLSGAYISSDVMHHGTTGQGISGHGDFMNGWDQEVLGDLIDFCINGDWIPAYVGEPEPDCNTSS